MIQDEDELLKPIILKLREVGYDFERGKEEDKNDALRLINNVVKMVRKSLAVGDEHILFLEIGYFLGKFHIILDEDTGKLKILIHCNRGNIVVEPVSSNTITLKSENN